MPKAPTVGDPHTSRLQRISLELSRCCSIAEQIWREETAMAGPHYTMLSFGTASTARGCFWLEERP